MYLLADIGGTSARFVLADEAGLIEETLRVFSVSEFASFSSVLAAYLDSSQKIEKAVIACAGPVRSGKAQMTNLNWSLSEAEISKLLDCAQVYLVNDLLASAWGLVSLPKSDFFELHSVDPKNSEELPCSVLSLGTGVGQSFLIESESKLIALPSEGSHSVFAPTNKLELELLEFLWKQLDFVSYEAVLSGQGLSSIYYFTSGVSKTSVKDISKLISQGDKRAKQAISIYSSALGTLVGNLNLALLSYGGCYLLGGVMDEILTHLDRKALINSYLSRAGLSETTALCPIRVIKRKHHSLHGAHSFLKSDRLFK